MVVAAGLSVVVTTVSGAEVWATTTGVVVGTRTVVVGAGTRVVVGWTAAGTVVSVTRAHRGVGRRTQAVMRDQSNRESDGDDASGDP